MERILMDNLVDWKDNPDRMPLILQGIMRCGKTHLLQDFGAKHFDDVLYASFSVHAGITDLFSQRTDLQRMLTDLSIYFERDIVPNKTLVILDDIHLCPAAIEALKHFDSVGSQYFITAAATFPSVALHYGFTIPTGSVELLTLRPMNFYEFLLVQSPKLATHLRAIGFIGSAYKRFQKQLEDSFREYQIIGGMPEAVSNWMETKSIESVNNILDSIIASLEAVFTKYCPSKMLPKLLSVWNSIPAQLAKSNRKFMFSKIKKSWRGKDLDDAIHWLLRTGLIYRVMHIDRPGIPLAGHINQSHFKLYMCDTGLLRRIGQFHSSVLMENDDTFADIKSSIVENIVCCELMRLYDKQLYYWSSEHPGKAEVEFIAQDSEELIPIEVKAGSAGRARSLIQYKLKFNPKKSVLTGKDTDKDDILPLYAFWNLKEWLQR